MAQTSERPNVSDLTSSRAPATTQFVEVDGVKFAYRVMGETRDGTVPLVLCNRFRGTMDEWDPRFIEGLAENRQLVLFDYEGVSSTTGTVPVTADALAASTAKFIKALGIEEVDLLAFSMGGYVVQILALTEKELVRRCVLCGAGCFGGEGILPPEEIFFQTATKSSWDADDKNVLFYAPADDSRARGKKAEGRISAQLRVGMEPKVSEGEWKNLLAAIQHAADPGNKWFSRMAEIEQPFLIMNGDRDLCYPLENQVILYRSIPNSRLAVFPMAGHAAHHQFPESAGLMIEDFLS